jgi:hypothetical protein
MGAERADFVGGLRIALVSSGWSVPFLDFVAKT